MGARTNSVPSHPLWRLVLNLPSHIQVGLLFVTFLVSISLASSTLLLSIKFYGYRIRSRNESRRYRVLKELEIIETGVGEKRRTVAGFFHPYCNAGGGGERVLWTAVACLQQEDKNIVCVVYTGDAVEETKAAMVAKVKGRFGIALDPSTLAFVPLRKRYLIEDTTWRRFTLLGQSFGSIFLALEGLRTGLIPDIWIDTMGYAFAYPLVKNLCHVPVGSYTHYPTISTDMLRRVQNREAGHTNTSAVAKSAILTTFKLFYYVIFAELYSLCLRQADVLMVNSTWTKDHINHLLRPFGYRDDASEADLSFTPSDSTPKVLSSDLRHRVPSAKSEVATSTPEKLRFRVAEVVYPPCDTIHLSALPIEVRERLILSVAQFRPEKEHHVQLHAFQKLLEKHSKYKSGPEAMRLVMAGSVRNEGDEARVEALRKLAKKLEIEDSVEFVINVPYPKLIELFGRASIGLHTMIDEHFGITVVEFMAAGLIPLVHASAGPLLDIVVPYSGLPTGFHATTPESFAEKLEGILELEEGAIKELRIRARKNAVERFSEEEFEKGWIGAWRQLIELS